MAVEPDRFTTGVLISPVVAPELRTIPKILATFLRSSLHEKWIAAWRAVVAFFQCSPRWFFHLMVAMRDYPLESRIAQVTGELLLIDAPLDRLATAAFAEQLAQASGGRASCAAVPNASHQVVTTHPDEVAALITEFVTQPSNGTRPPS